MTHFTLDTYHGPLVLTVRGADWLVSAPSRPSEVFTGVIPHECLRQARQVSLAEAVAILGDASPPAWAEAAFAHDGHDPVLVAGA